MIIRERQDRNSIDEIHCDNAAVKITRTAPDRFEMTVAGNGTEREFAYRAERAGSPLTMAVEDDVEYRAEATGVSTRGRLNSEQMDAGYYCVSIREGEPTQTEVYAHIRSSSAAEPIICEEISPRPHEAVAAEAA